VWENVPGVFSQHGGRDFAAVLGALVGSPVAVPADGWAGAGVAAGRSGTAAWRILDAQWFGVPQRRRRVFVVADFGGVRAEQVLFEREGSGGHPASRQEAGEGSACCFGKRVAGTLGAHRSGGTDPTDLERGGGVLVGERERPLSAERSPAEADALTETPTHRRDDQ
jgi:DNA (cytosine-5)-methyltransferase 1